MRTIQLMTALIVITPILTARASADPPPPPKSDDTVTAAPTTAKDLVREIRFGRWTAHFEETSLEEIGRELGGELGGYSVGNSGEGEITSGGSATPRRGHSSG
jgi:hypothetical protein